MSVIHIQQIKAHLESLYTDKVDLSDLKQSGNNLEQFFLTRSLAAYSIHYLAQADEADSAKSITDGSGDNGIDAIYFDKGEKRLYLCQSKWINNGKGEPDLGEIHKFGATGISGETLCSYWVYLQHGNNFS